MIGITVSVNYHIDLSLSLKKNYKLFDKWYIITSIDDEKTIEMCSKYCNVELLYFDFYKNASFNKGGAIKKAQEIIHQKYPNQKYCILDSDILLPKAAIEYLSSVDIPEDSILGLSRVSINEDNKLQLIKEDEHPCLGYFQVYTNPKVFYKDSNDCGWCDYEFTLLFQNKLVLSGVYCLHISEINSNWSGLTKLNLEMVKPIPQLRNGRYEFGLKEMIKYDDRIKGKMLEVGSYLGESTYIFASSNKFQSITCLDMWKGDYDENDESSHSNMHEIESNFDKFRNSCGDLITKIKDSSANIPSLFEDESFDFIYIDANHTYDAVKRDIEVCLPKLKKGKFIAGHDYSESWSEVKKAVDEIFGKPDKVFPDESWIKFIE